jgi:uncharacterized protein YbjT (DUF2867 family)
MSPPILLTGGTGTLGRIVGPLLRAAGRDVRVLSRHAQPSPHTDIDIGNGSVGAGFVIGDLATGDGVDAAVEGVDTIVHCAGSAKGDEDKARRLIEAASRAGVRHLVYISVVGAERVPVVSAVDRAMFGYFASKRAAELVVERSGVPWTTLRASQFHDLALMTATQMAKLPVIPVPAGVKFQPVDTREVAERLVELTLAEPSGLAPDMAGPRVYRMGDLLRSYLIASHRRRVLLPVRLPGKAALAIRAGANLAPDRAVGRRTWESFLAERLGSESVD